MSAGEQFHGNTLAVTDVAAERELAARCIARMAHDAEDEALLLDVVLGETQPIAEEEAGEEEADKPARKHGTARMYRWEIAQGIEPCQPCRDAIAKLRKQEREKAKALLEEAAAAADKCGTLRGYRIHLENRDVPCQPCCDANAASSRKYRPGPTKNQPVNTECGTDGGYKKHVRRHRKACQPCKDAHAEVMREYRAGKREAA